GTRVLTTAAAVGLVALALAPEASAIPAFTRKYQTSCATCHSVFPRLTPVGESFRLNGYKFQDDETYIKDKSVELGDEAYKKVWPKAIWPTDVPGLPPVSVRALFDYDIDLGGEEDASTSFRFLDEYEVLIGGSIGNNLSGFGEIEFEDGEAMPFAWLQFEDLLVPENLLNLRVGSLGMHSLGLYTARDHNRVTKEHYDYASWRVPYPKSGFDEKNEFRLRDEQPGVELNGFGARWLYAAGVVNGNAEVDDNNDAKDFYGQLALKLGGVGLDGSGAKLGEGLKTSGNPWVDDSLTLSAFGYAGQAVIKTSDVVTGTLTTSGEETDDDFWRAGAGALWKWQDLELGGGAVWGNNDQPYGALSKAEVDSLTWFAEAGYFVYPWLIPAVRYEALDLDLPSGVSGLSTAQDKNQVIASIKFLIRANVALTTEGRFYTKNETLASKSDGSAAVVRLDYSF
ncbi:MAG: hypothetical protein HYV36_08380, partial [Lentisphaerae bacterium]|nr:hypothetical protein [Lentisphaerota bacterium]